MDSDLKNGVRFEQNGKLAGTKAELAEVKAVWDGLHIDWMLLDIMTRGFVRKVK